MDDKSDILPAALQNAGGRWTLTAPRARGLIIAAVLIVFSPVLLANFSGWDDAMNVTGNASLHPPTLAAVASFWRRPLFAMYAPLPYTAWAGLVAIFSDRSALPFHATNLLAHAIAALAVFELLRAVSRSVAAACLGALMFALHPLAVEPVAWVTGLRDTLAQMFGCVALALYFRPSRSAASYVGSIAVLLAGLASKPSIAVLSAIALLIDLALRRRGTVACAMRALPWLLSAVVCVIIGRSVQGASQIAPITRGTDRLLVMLDSYSFYLEKYLWPYPLGLDYGRRPELVIQRGWSALSWMPAVVVAIAISAFAVACHRRWPLVLLACWTVALLPTSGLLSFDFQAYSTVGDRYAYVALLVPALWASRWSRPRWRIGLVGLVAIWGVLSFVQASTWRTTESVSRQALRANPASWMSLETLARSELNDDQPRLAFEHATRAAQLNPQLLRADLDAGQAAQRIGDFAAAIQAFSEVLKQQPSNVRAENGLAESLLASGRTTEGFSAYQRAVEISPDNVVTLINFAASLAERGEWDRAEKLYRRVLGIDAANAEARLGLQMVQRQRKS